jgi:hypothetical protein
VLRGNAINNLWVLDLTLGLLDIRQAELQLITTLKILRIHPVFCSHSSQSLSLSLNSPHLENWLTPYLELTYFGTGYRILPESPYITSTTTAEKIQPLLLESVYRIIA